MSSNSATRYMPSVPSIDENDRLTQARSQTFPLGRVHGLCTGNCPLSLSRYLLSIAVSSISKQSWEKHPERGKENSTHAHAAKEEFEPMSNLNRCQSTLWDQDESSILTRRFVTVGLEESTFSLYRTYPLRRAIKSQLIELSMSPFKEEILLSKIIQPLSNPPLQHFYLASKAYVLDIHNKDPRLNREQAQDVVTVEASFSTFTGAREMWFISKKEIPYKNTMHRLPRKGSESHLLVQNIPSTHLLLYWNSSILASVLQGKVSWRPTTSFEIKIPILVVTTWSCINHCIPDICTCECQPAGIRAVIKRNKGTWDAVCT